MAKQKTCTKCGGSGPFSKNRNNADGLNAWCTVCDAAYYKSWYYTPRGRALGAWKCMNSRAGNRDGKNPSYKHVKVLMTKEEFLAWAIPAFAVWLQEHPNESPTIDRPNGGHYVLTGPNKIRIISNAENARLRPGARNTYAPAGKHWCSTCKKYLSRTEFYLFNKRRTVTGVAEPSSKCKKHAREIARVNYHRRKQNAK